MREAWIGRPVRLKKRVSADQRPTIVVALYSDIEGGVRLMDERGGFVSWNVADLTPVRMRELRGREGEETNG